MKLFRQVFAGLVFVCGLLAVGAGLSACSKGLGDGTTTGALCAQACNNFAARCGLSGSSSFSSSSSSGTTADCVQMCDRGLGSKSGSSSTQYKDLLACVANAKSCVEIQNACNP